MKWGAPSRVTDDGAGGQIVVYANQGFIPGSTFYDGYGGASTSRSISFWDYKMFWIDSNGKIYHWMTQRQQIPPAQIDLNIYRKN